MPIYQTKEYTPPLWLRNGHVNTIYAGAVKRVETPNYRRSVIRTMDDDFVIIDRLAKGFHRLAVLCHGLEGSSESAYISSMARHLHRNGFDVLCINFRSCGGKMNRSLQMYHSGDTRDLHMVLKYHQDAYRSIDLVGFSLGGNVVLKYMGEDPDKVHHKVRKAVGISVPVDLAAGARRLTEWQNLPYAQMFLKTLKEKIRKKAKQYPDVISTHALARVRTVIDFDNLYTGPLHGFLDAEDYYRRSNSLQFLDRIDRPSLLINAEDDPFLTRACFPEEQALENSNFFLYQPRFGGHVGFEKHGSDAPHHEAVTLEFLLDNDRS